MLPNPVKNDSHPLQWGKSLSNGTEKDGLKNKYFNFFYKFPTVPFDLLLKHWNMAKMLLVFGILIRIRITWQTVIMLWQWSTTNWRFQVWLNNTLNNIIRCKKLATIDSSRKYVAQPFVRRKQVSTSVDI